MNAVLATFILLVVTFIWRGVSSWTPLQKCLHFFGPLAPLLQWYTIMFIGIGFLVFRTFYDIVVFEYLKYDFLTKNDMMQSKDFIPDLPDAEREALAISPWLKTFSLVAPVAGVLAALVVAEHVYAIVKASARRTLHKWEVDQNRQSRRALLWNLDKETNMVLMVVAMPIVFILMAMRAEVRIWAVMTGSAWLPYQDTGATLDKWEEVKTLEMSVYTSDIEMAGVFVYLTIFCFGRLCTSYLRDAPPEYRMALKYAGLQGVYLYVIFGALRSLATMAVTVASSMHKYAFIAAVLQNKVLIAIGPVFTVATLLCVYNMLVIGGMSDIKAKLGSANLKFQGVRFLVLIAQIQLTVLTGLTVGSSLYQQAEKLPEKYAEMVHSWHLSTYRAQLLHAALLNFECLAVVLFQRCVWRANALYGLTDARELGEGLREQLIPVGPKDVA